MKNLFLTMCVMFTMSAHAEPTRLGKKLCDKKQIVVAVADTGFGIMEFGKSAKLCQTGHKDFTATKVYSSKYNTKDPIPADFEGHGTNVIGLIDKYAAESGVDYCIVVLKYYEKDQYDLLNLKFEVDAINYANEINADILNISGGGRAPAAEETAALKNFLDAGGNVIAAAGNEHQDLSEHPYYPAMSDPRIVIVGSKDFNGKPSWFSNYGKQVRIWEDGDNVTAYGVTSTGTSQSTAIATGKILAHLKNKCYKH